MNEYPLTNEPNILVSNAEVLPYNDILIYRNTEYAIVDQLKSSRSNTPPDFMQPFIEVMQLHYSKTQPSILTTLTHLYQKYNCKDVTLSIKLYDSIVKTRFSELITSLI